VSLLPKIENIAREAGAGIMAIYARDFAVEHKADQSPLTEADTAANRIIVDALRQLTPDIPILSEEAVEQFAGPNAQGQYWLVDPLDGTKEFIKRNGEFTVNIALIENGKPTLGVVYAPALGALYAAAKGQGAFKVDEAGQRTPLQVTAHTPGTPWKVVGSRSHADAKLTAWLEQLDDYELVPMGSSLKFCLVAEGRAHIYPRLGPTSLWDTAAGQCVVEQAGGKVVQLSGQPLGYADTSNRLNPHFIVESAASQ
jgi:3'(2'), 5'-bisphosphate nucleotidase